jgi:hypothetical protein
MIRKPVPPVVIGAWAVVAMARHNLRLMRPIQQRELV